ncbi:UDP-2,4-diacetamido-2,4,6-trideoxy-beta-L-altropyranose hydrolase [Thermodesulfobacteriota bacterium]
MGQKIVIRADASIQIGSGHIMRCLTLANELKIHGAKVQFICRNFPGQMKDLIHQHSHQVTLLPPSAPGDKPESENPAQINWLGVPLQQDAEDTIKAMGNKTIDWLIVDHYGINHLWHKTLRNYTNKIMVIDDLADRKLNCDLLLDQTYGRKDKTYNYYVPEGCKVLLGSIYALLRPEFALLRPKALTKRKSYNGIKCILVCMGGADPNNFTGKVLDGLSEIEWKQEPLVNVVLGGKAPHLSSIIKQAKSHHQKINVLSDVKNMAELMLEADLAIGAGGTTSWERCALGLPALIAVLAENQKLIASTLENLGALKIWKDKHDLKKNLISTINSREQWQMMQTNASSICDANGCARVAKELISYDNY